ncbi:MAG: DUF1385 domain-containing protein [Clostridiaceae bacterium]|nr:DUF1385 domain-containing protein [Clostridiaceae bacterium]
MKQTDSRACFRTLIGGQALIEGIMMRGPDKSSIVVRREDGTLVEKTEPLRKGKKPAILNWYFIRGVYSFGSSMLQGVRALFYSADTAFETVQNTEAPSRLERRLGTKRFNDLLMTFSAILGVALPIVLFFFLPTLLAGTLDRFIGSGILRNLCEGAIRIILFLLFMFSISHMKDIQRTFEYHGAEHKSIACYESGAELTVENARGCKKEHPRCGTSFLLVVMIVSILVFSVVSWSNPLIRLALRLVLLPVVVAISYEINRAVGRHDNAFTRAVRAPGLWLQKLTTREPDDSMLEVAITALKAVIPAETGADRW